MTHITKENFEAEIKNAASELILMDFFADWCGPCKMLAPILEELEKELPSCKVCKVNIDEEAELAEAFSVMSVPTLVLLKNGTIAAQRVGYASKEVIKHWMLGDAYEV